MYSILVYRYCTVLLDHTVTLVQIGRPGDLYMYSILVYRYCTVLLDHTVTLVQIERPVAARPICTSVTVLL
eukprot:COSAG05_NODE_6802_length_900_cov_2.283396_2_plen_71_part_00